MRLLNRWLEDAHAAPDTRHVDACDGLRAAAILIIGWYHIWQQSWLGPYLTVSGRHISFEPLVRSGYMWVDVMILISGFCLYLPWARGEERPAAAFYARRLARIHPSYLLAVCAALIVALLTNAYLGNARWLLRDLLSHLTYTQTFFYDAYYASNLGGTLWTLAVEMQFYLIFPLLARAFCRAPGVVFALMTVSAFAFRLWVGETQADISLYFNQLPAFLDVFALGMAAAAIHVRLSRVRRGPLSRALCSAGALALLPAIWRVVRMQASLLTTEAIRQGQMDHRILLASLVAAFLLLSGNGGLCLRRLLSNPATRFVSAVSMQFYIWHQTLAVWLLEWRVVPSPLEHPNYDGDTVWQLRYTLLCFAAALALAALLTYGFERPAARALLGQGGGKGARGRKRRRPRR